MIVLLAIVLSLVVLILLAVCRRLKNADQDLRDFERYLWAKYLERGNRR